MNETTREFRFKALLAEHELTRQEINATNSRKVTLIQFYLLYLTGSYAYIATGSTSTEIPKAGFIPLVGIGSVGFLAAWVFEHQLVLLLSRYLRDELEVKGLTPHLAQPTGKSVVANGVVGWQHYFGANMSRSATALYKIFSLVLFGLVGVLPSVVISLLMAFDEIDNVLHPFGRIDWLYAVWAGFLVIGYIWCQWFLFAGAADVERPEQARSGQVAARRELARGATSGARLGKGSSPRRPSP